VYLPARLFTSAKTQTSGQNTMLHLEYIEKEYFSVKPNGPEAANYINSLNLKMLEFTYGSKNLITCSAKQLTLCTTYF